MRTLRTIVIIVVLLLGGSWVSYRYIESTTQTLGAKLETVEQSITAQNWEVSQEELNTAQQLWDKNKSWCSLLLDHQEIDIIRIGMKRLEKYIETQNVSLSLGEVSALKLQVEHISDSEKLALSNIL